MTQEVKAIEILPLTDQQKKSLISSADSATKVYGFSFSLSSRPSQKWTEIFRQIWQEEYGTTSVPRFGGSSIQATSTLQNLQNVVNGLKLVAAKTNESYEKFLEEEKTRQDTLKKQRDEAKRSGETAMADALDKLKV